MNERPARPPAGRSALGLGRSAIDCRRAAAREYRASLRLEGHRSITRVNLGNVEAGRGRWRLAERCYRRALRDSSSDYDAMNNLATALIQQGRKRAEARTWAVRAVEGSAGRDSVYRATLDQVDRGAR